jgi:hypothetical protein
MVTAYQTVKMYELLNKHFKSTDDAKALVAGIEEIIDEKFNNEKDRLATKQDIFALKEDMKKDIFVMREDTKKIIFALKEDVFALQTRMEQGFKDQLKWTIVLMLGMTSLFVAAIKLL